MIDSILGVDHVGIGVRDMTGMREFYGEAFGFTRVLAEMPMEDHEAIHGLLRAPRAIHSSTLLGQEAGQLTLALFHAAEPPPRPIREDPRYGDIGVAKTGFHVGDLDAFVEGRERLLRLHPHPKTFALPDGGEYRFVLGRDPEGNLFGIGAGITEAPADGPCLRSVGIAVTDLERSLSFYRDVLGFDRVEMAPHGSFSGLVDEATGHVGTAVRSCLLANGRGQGSLELFEVTKPRGRSIPFGTQWGDFGYLQVCLYASDGERLSDQIRREEAEMLLRPQAVDDPTHPAAFLYLRDPDGIPVEILVSG